MNDEQDGGDGPSDPWATAEGHVGAAPPPTWNRPDGWTAPDPDAAPGSSWAADSPPSDRVDPPPSGTHDVVDEPTGTPLTKYGTRYPSDHQPYGVGAFSDHDTYYDRRRRYLGQRRPLRTYASGRGPTSYKALGWLIAAALLFFWTGVVPVLAAVIAWICAVRVRRNATTRSFRAPPARAWMIGSVVLSVLAIGGMLLLILVEIPSGNSVSGDHYPDSVDLTGTFGRPATLQAEVSYGPAKHDPFVPVRITATNYQTGVDLPQSPDVTATVDLTLCADQSALDSDAIRDDVTLSGPSGTEIDTVDDMPGAGEGTTEIYPHSCVDLPVGFHVPTGTDVTTLQYEPIPQTITWALPAPTPAP